MGLIDPEKCIEWLKRMDIKIEETATIEKFQRYLQEEFAATPKQMDALWKATVWRYEDLAPMGVRPVVVEYPWGTEMRWGIKGFPGLWGWKGMQRITGWTP